MCNSSRKNNSNIIVSHIVAFSTLTSYVRCSIVCLYFCMFFILSFFAGVDGKVLQKVHILIRLFCMCQTLL